MIKDLDCDSAISEASALQVIFQSLKTLPDAEDRARLLAMVALKHRFYAEAKAFIDFAIQVSG